MERCRDEPCGEGEAEVEVACGEGRWRQLGWQILIRSERVIGFLKRKDHKTKNVSTI